MPNLDFAEGFLKYRKEETICNSFCMSFCKAFSSIRTHYVRWKYELFEEVGLCRIKADQLRNPSEGSPQFAAHNKFLLDCITESLKLTLHVRYHFSYLTLP
jgi:hypothetical protein